MIKRLMSLTLCVFLLLSLAVPALAEEENTITVKTVQEFLDLAESCRLDSYSLGITVVLAADIDLTGTDFTGIPVFSGTFDGAGHRISGLLLTAPGSDQGLFRYLTESAVVRDLTLQAVVQPEGSRSQIGTLAGRNAGTVTGCTVTTQLTGSSRVGGVAGVNAATGVIENCTVDGNVHGDHFVGGIAGENLGVIRFCKNTAQVNTTPQENSVDISDITMDTLTNSEAAGTVTDIGGIAGISSGVIRGCENRGDVGYKHMGYNIGGIAGTQSGFLTECINYACIQGRKEVGGIVGQMEPVMHIAYDRDALQQLEGELGTMSQMVNKASSNAMTGVAELEQQMTELQNQADAAKAALDVILGDGETVPDPDQLLAAYNSLGTALNQMPQTLDSIAATTQNTAGQFGEDMRELSGQVGTMGETVRAATQNLGVAILDVSDRDTAEDLTGKVSGCVNEGDVLADLNAGGIAGAMSMENDLDILGDYTTAGESSANFETQVRAVLVDCENHGSVTGKKQYAGGIVGGQLLGLVKNCVNTGALDSAGAEYVGGIAGYSLGTVRSAYAKCEITAAGTAGGIAGSGTVVTDCRTIVKFTQPGEKTGAILGWRETSGEETPIAGNYYLVVEKDLGAIDGISYDGLAQPMTLEQFAVLEGLPESFSQITVRFVREDGTATEVQVPLGGDLDSAQVPVLPQKSGHSGQWEGLESEVLKGLLFDCAFRAVYTPYSTTIASEDTRQGKPVLLAEGSFTPDARATAVKSTAVPVLKNGQSLLECWSVMLTEPAETARLLLPETAKQGRLMLLVQAEDGTWKETEFTLDGSYCVFRLPAGGAEVAVVQTGIPYWYWILVGGGVLLLAGGVLLIVKLRKRKQQAESK